MSGAQPHDLADRFNDRLAARLRSPTWERVYRTAFGDEYPDETDSNGYYSRTTLQRLSMALKLDARSHVGRSGLRPRRTRIVGRQTDGR